MKEEHSHPHNPTRHAIHLAVDPERPPRSVSSPRCRQNINVRVRIQFVDDVSLESYEGG
jgi:hypothetical protein